VNYTIFQCHSCGREHLLNLSDLTAELLGERIDTPTAQSEAIKEEPTGETSEPWEEGWDEYVEPTEEYRPSDYKTEQRGTDTVQVRQGINNHSGGKGGISVETMVDGNRGNAIPARHYRQVKMEPMGTATPARPKSRTRSVSNPSLEVSGENASQDFLPEYNDMSPADRHMDQLLQAEYEADLTDRGFNSTVI
jgi:hypothetical protein